MIDLKGLFPVLPTTLRNGKIDEDSIETLVSAVAPYVDGLTVLGSSGESAYFSFTERRRALVAFAKAAAQHDLPLIAGITDPSLHEARTFVSCPEAESVAAFLVLPPTYYPATLAATERQLSAIATATERPIVFYDIPSLSGLGASPSAIITLASRIPSIQYVKIASLDIERVREFASAGELGLFAGYDDILHEQVAEGCSGAMVPVIAMCPGACRRWFDALDEGKRQLAFTIFIEEIAPLCRAMVGTDVDFIGVIKRLLHHQGVIGTEETVPGLPSLSPARVRQVDEAIAYLESRVPTRG
jgi:dihydrodipicolinate synthase/N-acetylneuraminate lyase